jgi:HAD superfamily hydrolase (TIGR01509 family)
MVKIKAVIFDMDGVLIEAKDWHYESLNKALGLFGMEISRYDHLVSYDGLPTKKKLEMMSLERGLPRELHEFINTMKQIYTVDIVHTKCRPVFYHQYAISKLLQENYRMAVCSNSIRNSIEVMLSKAGIIEHFEFILSNQDVNKPKPDPEIYINAMNKLGLKPEECLILEDNENGIKSAIASGAHLLKIITTGDVNYENIKRRIIEIEEEGK